MVQQRNKAGRFGKKDKKQKKKRKSSRNIRESKKQKSSHLQRSKSGRFRKPKLPEEGLLKIQKNDNEHVEVNVKAKRKGISMKAKPKKRQVSLDLIKAGAPLLLHEKARKKLMIFEVLWAISTFQIGQNCIFVDDSTFVFSTTSDSC